MTNEESEVVVQHHSLSQPRILIVDDNPDTTSTLTLLLRTVGYQTAIAHNGLDAINAVKKEHPNVILLDLRMPKMSGIDVCLAIRQMDLERQPAIIAMTGYGSDRDVEFCLENGFDGHSVKGQEFSQLKAKIEQLLAEKAAT